MKTYTIDEIKTMSHDHPIIAFDGVCNMCNGYIQWLISKDSKRQFRYTTLQSKEGEKMVAEAAIDGETVLLFYKNKIYDRSDVGLISFKILGGLWTMLSWLKFLPKGLRDVFYKWLARNRYRLFGKSDACMVPGPEIRSLFL